MLGGKTSGSWDLASQSVRRASTPRNKVEKQLRKTLDFTYACLEKHTHVHTRIDTHTHTLTEGGGHMYRDFFLKYPEEVNVN